MKSLQLALQDEVSRQAKKPDDIEELVLDNKCNASDLKALADFPNLKKLSLSGTRLSSLDDLPRLPKLIRLVLSDNRISSGLGVLTTATPSLQVLDLANNRIGDIQELQVLAPLKLKSLDLFQCPVEANTPNFRKRIFEMVKELEYLDNVDHNGQDRDGDDDDEEEYDEEGEGYEGEEEAGGEAEAEGEEYEDGEDEEGEEGEDFQAAPGGPPLPEDEEDYEEEEGDDEDEKDDEDDDDEEEEEAAGASGSKKRKREEAAEEEDDDE